MKLLCKHVYFKHFFALRRLNHALKNCCQPHTYAFKSIIILLFASLSLYKLHDILHITGKAINGLLQASFTLTCK